MRKHLGTRTFEPSDQQRFAVLSGDWNPLHVDPVAARRTMFGEPVVHGVHLATWALDCALRERGGRVRIDHVRASFAHPTHLRRPVTLDLLTTAEPDVVALVATSGGAKVLDLTARLAPAANGDGEGTVLSRSWPDRERALELGRDDLAAASGALPLGLQRDMARELFPGLVADNAAFLAELLATTRVVGMFCPGLHSLYSGLELRRRATTTSSTELGYRVATANLRYSLVSLEVEGPTLEGKLETFYRPPPSPPLSMAAVSAAVSPGELAGQRALVVGGSRGLGEAFAKAIAAGGGEVCVTYHRGADEAQRVVDDIVEAGFRASAFDLDVTAPGDLASRWPVSWKPTHVYYFATPFIRVDKAAAFSVSDFEVFTKYYVAGLHATAQALCALGATEMTVWAPSTTFLDSLERGSASYCAAKAAMEELARHLPSMLPVRVLTPRLPRAATDQTASLIPRRSADPIALAVEHLRAAHAKIGTSSL